MTNIEEKRYFIKYKMTGGPMFVIHHGEFHQRPDGLRTAYVQEIPKEFWSLSLKELTDYFEHKIKPRMRVQSG